jgi:tetratricopeptide (TPR) repeat protein
MLTTIRSVFSNVAASAAGDREAFSASVTAGDAARDHGEWSNAVFYYRKALALRPQADSVSVQLGHALKESGDYGAAEAAYRQFLEAHPRDADIHLQFGHLFNKKGDIAAALEWYEKAQALDPDDNELAKHVGAARSALADFRWHEPRRTALELAAGRYWQKAKAALVALVDESGQEDLVGVLANVCKEAGDFGSAERFYERYRLYAATRDLSRQYDAALQSGHFYKVFGDYGRALSYFIEARRFSHSEFLLTAGHEVLAEIRLCRRELFPVFAGE